MDTIMDSPVYGKHTNRCSCCYSMTTQYIGPKLWQPSFLFPTRKQRSDKEKCANLAGFCSAGHIIYANQLTITARVHNIAM